MAVPGFTGDACLTLDPVRYQSRAPIRRAAAAEISPSAVLVWAGHCGCLADQWLGLPCICYDIVPDPAALPAPAS